MEANDTHRVFNGIVDVVLRSYAVIIQLHNYNFDGDFVDVLSRWRANLTVCVNELQNNRADIISPTPTGKDAVMPSLGFHMDRFFVLW